MKSTTLAAAAATVVAASAAFAGPVTMDWSTVGNAGNAADPTTGFGAVAYEYRIGTYEVTNSQYAAFLNSVAASDPNGLYSTSMGGGNGGITRSGSDGSYTYSVKASMGDKPVNYVSWYDAARMSNWMTNGQGSGGTESGVYTFDGVDSISAITRDLNNPNQVFIPTEDEWYKAAYHQPADQGGDTDGYWLYATQSNSVPTIATATSTGDVANPGQDVVNYLSGAGWNGRIGWVTTVGSAGSTSFCGAFDMNGNVFEWNETLIGSGRGFRGGWFASFDEFDLRSSSRGTATPTNEFSSMFGFRLASPMPGHGDTEGDRIFRTVALTGDQVPGAATGVVFNGFPDAPVLNAAGQTAFVAELTGPGVSASNRFGVYSEGSGALTEVVRRGSDVPEASAGVTFNGLFEGIVLNAAGHTAFRDFLSGPGVGVSNGEGIYSDRSGTLSKVVRRGDQVVGAVPGVVFGDFSGGPVLNAAGQTAFFGRVISETGVLTPGIYSEGSGSLAEVVRVGDPAPGAASGAIFSSLDFFDFPVLNAAGKTIFWSSLNVASFRNGLYSDRSGMLAQVVGEGDQAPGAGSGVVFSDFSDPVLNGAGHAAFVGRLAGPGVNGSNRFGIYSEGSGTLTKVVRVGDQAPGAAPGVVFNGFDFRTAPVLNAAGQTAFFSFLIGPNVDFPNDRGIYSEGLGTLAKVARGGDQAPNAPSGFVFRDFSSPVLNAAGQTAFIADLTRAAVSGVIARGIYATDLGGQLVEVVREGSTLDVNDDPLVDDLRTVTSFSLLLVTGSGNEDGRPSGFNDSGQVAFRAVFPDGTQGIFVSNAAAALPGLCPADFNDDGSVDASDVLDLIAAVNALDTAADLDGSGTVDFFDLGDFLGFVDAGCP